jgi:glycosyltransferase involved in cell wall biosynthesis
MSKLISVVIPVYNVAGYLERTIECILEQAYTNWELILVDDGSTDGSIEIANKYSEKDERIKTILRDTLPKGAPHCRNIGMDMAKGEYLIYLDSDDIIAPYCFQQRVDYIEANNCDFAVFPLVGFYEKLFDADGMIFGYKPEGDDVAALLSRTLPFVVVSNIYKRSRLVESRVRWDMELKSYQDSDYNLQVIKAGLTYKISNLLPDYFYRLSATNSICKKLTTKSQCESQIRFIEKQAVIYGNNKYRKALDICAAQIFRNILFSESREESTELLVKSKLFQNRPFFRQRIRWVSRLTSNNTSRRQLEIIQLLLLPTFFIHFKWAFHKWYKNCRKTYSEVRIIYKEKVSLPMQELIEAKI